MAKSLTWNIGPETIIGICPRDCILNLGSIKSPLWTILVRDYSKPRGWFAGALLGMNTLYHKYCVTMPVALRLKKIGDCRFGGSAISIADVKQFVWQFVPGFDNTCVGN